MNPRRRWVTRPRSGGAGAVVVEVAAGAVVVASTGGPVVLGPDEVERLRQALALARAAVIWDRDRW